MGAFKGVVNVDIRDSSPTDSVPTSRRPRGISERRLHRPRRRRVGCARAATAVRSRLPTSTAIAADGVRYSQWHTTALCSPTRSCLLTGPNDTRNSMACITEAAIGFPNASGTHPPANGMLSESSVRWAGTPTWWASGTSAPRPR